jgi:hypothetical protein
VADKKKPNHIRYRDNDLDFLLFSEPGKLNPNALKTMFKDIKWIHVPRQLSKKFNDFFYIGTYEDDERKVHIKVRPTRQANITESLIDVVPAGAGGRGYANCGCYCTVKVEDSFLDKIKQAAKELPRVDKQSLSWD